uniref:Uncharacterized protein n=1 Tax=Ciona intestinalis TaxID=7719 RepID=H2Y186_CIOIN
MKFSITATSTNGTTTNNRTNLTNLSEKITNILSY